MKNTKNMPASTIVKAAAVQITPVLYSRQGTVEKVVRKIHELGKQGVQFATFPETVVPYYHIFLLSNLPTRSLPVASILSCSIKQ